MSKDGLLDWVNKQQALDVTSKFILYRLAQFADADNCAWAKVSTLVEAVNCSERTVQSRLRKLEEGGYLRQTGRLHRLQHSTRSVPIYLIGPGPEATPPLGSMGANSAPIENLWVQETASMGATVCTPYELKEPIEGSCEPSRRASEREAVFVQIEEAYPRAGIGVSDRSQALRAFHDLADRGVDVAALPAAAARFAADPTLKRRDYGPVSLQRWLAEGRYRGWLADDPAIAPPSASAECVFAGPPELRAAIVMRFGEGKAISYLDRSTWRAADRAIVPATGPAFDFFNREARRLLREHDVRLVRAAAAGQVQA